MADQGEHTFRLAAYFPANADTAPALSNSGWPRSAGRRLRTLRRSPSWPSWSRTSFRLRVGASLSMSGSRAGSLESLQCKNRSAEPAPVAARESSMLRALNERDWRAAVSTERSENVHNLTRCSFWIPASAPSLLANTAPLIRHATSVPSVTRFAPLLRLRRSAEGSHQHNVTTPLLACSNASLAR